jgi:hypothetical protein
MQTYEDPTAWAPEPVRPRWSLTLKFVATLLFRSVQSPTTLSTRAR